MTQNPFMALPKVGGRAPAGNPFMALGRRADTRRDTVAGGKQDRSDIPGAVEDTLVSAGAGYLEGVGQLAGLPGDVRELGRAGLQYLKSKSGSDIGGQAVDVASGAVRKLPIVGTMIDAFRSAPTSQQVISGMESVIGPLPKSETTSGEYARTIGSFAPAAMAGPGGAARKAAMAVVPAVASETAGQLTKGTPAEPYARAGAALAGGFATAGRKSGLLKSAVKKAPAAETVKAETDAAYDALRASGVKYDANAYVQFLRSLEKEFKDKGFRAKQAPKASDAVDYMIEHIGKSLEFSDLESIRRTARNAAQSADSTDRGVASLIIERLDEFAASAPLITSGNIPANQVGAATKSAREMASRVIKTNQIEDMIDAARGYQEGFEGGLRRQFSNLLRNKKRLRGFTPMEREAIADVAHGRRLISALGRFGFDFSKEGNKAIMLPTLGGGLAAYGTADPFTAAATVAVGSAAKVGSRKLTDAAARRAQGITLLGKEKQKEIAGARRNELLKRRIRQGLAIESSRGALERSGESRE